MSGQKEEYVMVPLAKSRKMGINWADIEDDQPKDSKDSKAPPVKSDDKKLPGVLVMHPRVSGLMRGKGVKGNKVVTNIVLTGQVASAANTALTTVTSLVANNAQDWSSFSSVFDMARVLKIKFHIRLAAGGTLNGTASWGVAFDPSNGGAYGSTADVLTAAMKLAPVVILNTTATAPDFSMTKNGFLNFGRKLEHQRITNDGGATALVGGGWFGTSDTTSVLGYLKPYCPSLGAGVTANLEYYAELLTEFKWRT